MMRESADAGVCGSTVTSGCADEGLNQSGLVDRIPGDHVVGFGAQQDPFDGNLQPLAGDGAGQPGTAMMSSGVWRGDAPVRMAAATESQVVVEFRVVADRDEQRHPVAAVACSTPDHWAVADLGRPLDRCSTRAAPSGHSTKSGWRFEQPCTTTEPVVMVVHIRGTKRQSSSSNDALR